MKNRVQNRTFPPRWFDLRKYNGIEDFGAYQWFHHLVVRNYFAQRFLGLFDVPDKLSEAKLAAENKLLSSLRQKPLILTDEMIAIYHRKPGDYRDLVDFAGVRSMTWKDLYQQEAQIPEILSTFARHHFREKELTDGVPSPEPEWTWDPIFHLSRDERAAGLLVVDPELPDEVLDIQFHSQLSDIRASHPAGLSKHKGPSLKKWRDAKLLPCMDLLMWGMEQHQQISTSELARALFPFELLKADVVRKTTRPLAVQFLEPLTKHPRGWTLLRRLKVEVVHKAREMERARMKIAKRTGKKVSANFFPVGCQTEKKVR